MDLNAILAGLGIGGAGSATTGAQPSANTDMLLKIGKYTAIGIFAGALIANIVKLVR
jgi:hypothetical protein